MAENDPTANTAEGDVRAFLEQAVQRFNMAAAAEQYSRREGKIDIALVDGEGQWERNVKESRMADMRPCLTMNRFIPMIAHVANEQRLSHPSIQVDPIGGGADKDSAQVRQGLMRHIEIESDAETVYDNAFEAMIEKGWSWIRVVSEWESETSPFQCLRIEGFRNDFCVYVDPNAKHPTRRDINWGFIVHDMPRGEYKRKHPNSKLASLASYQSIGDETGEWFTNETVRVAEYYYVDEIPARVVYLIDDAGRRYGVFSGEVPKGDEWRIETEDDGTPAGRDSFKRVVKWALINAAEILEGNKDKTAGREWKGKWIPLIRVTGRERLIDGQIRLSGMVRNNRDAQRMYNYAISGFVEMMSLAPKAPYIVVAGQVEKYKSVWGSLNTKNWPYLPYDMVDKNGQNAPPPQRQFGEPAIMAWIQAIREMDNDLKIGFNIFDPSLGKSGATESGRGIIALQRKSESGNANWIDNLRRSQVQTAEVINDLIPTRYDAARVLTIVRPDNKRQEIVINQEFMGPDGKAVNYDLSTGKYSCTISIGEYATRRQEAVGALIEIVKNTNIPEVTMALLPMILDAMDAPMTTEAAELIRKIQPAKMQVEGSPEQVQAQMQELMQQHEELVKALEQANQVIGEKSMETASKEYIAGLQVQAQIAIASAKLGSVEGMHGLTQEYKRITDLLNLNQNRLLAESQQGHEKELQEMQPKPAGGAA